MSHPIQNKGQVVYNKGIPNTQMPVHPNNPAQFQRYTMQPGQKPNTMVGNPNNYNYQNMGFDNIKAHNSGQIKSSYNQLAGNEIYDEIYTIDPNTNEKHLLKTNNQTQPPKPKTHVNTPVKSSFISFSKLSSVICSAGVTVPVPALFNNISILLK